MRITLKAVAAAAGVSVSAASHAVNRSGTLKSATRDHILREADRLGYVRDPLLSRLAAQRFQNRQGCRARMSILSFTGPGHRYGNLNEFQPTRVGPRLNRLGLELESVEKPQSMAEAQKLLRRLYHRGVDLLAIENVSPAFSLGELDFRPFVVIGVGDVDLNFPFHRVELDWDWALRSCVRHLHSRGCQRVGLQLTESEPPTLHDRIRRGAWLTEIEGAGIAPLCFHRGEEGRNEQQQRALRQWLQRTRPDGLILWRVMLGAYLRGQPGPVLPAVYFNLTDQTGWERECRGVIYRQERVLDLKLRYVYDLLIHAERGIPEHPLTHRIRGHWQDPKAADGGETLSWGGAPG